MLRINLLPSYVNQRRLARRLMIGFSFGFLLCLLVPLAYYLTLENDLKIISAKADDAEAGKRITDSRKAQAAAARTGVKPTQDKLDFVFAVDAYTRQWVALYNTLADSSPRSTLIYTDASVTGPTMTIKAYSPSVADVGRYLQAMYNEPDFKDVGVDKVPGYPDNVRHLYYLKGKLVFADGMTSATDSPGASQPGAQGAAPTGYTPSNLGPNSSTTFPPGVGPPPMELTGVVVSSNQSGQPSVPVAPGGSALATDDYSPAFLAISDRDISPFALPETREAIRRNFLRQVVVKLAPRGFDLTVTATLKQPLTPPPLPGTAPSAAPARAPGFGGGPSGITRPSA